MHIAIIGTGIAGLTCAELLRREHQVTVFEAQPRPGGHTHTVSVPVSEGTVEADTGFLVYTERTYPLLCRLFDRLGITTQPADMSFSVRDEHSGREWRGTSIATVFAQPVNALRPAFWRMLVDIGRFNRLARSLVATDDPGSADTGPTLADVLSRGSWSTAFIDGYLVPIGSAIWSADPTTFTEMPAATFATFFERHGLLRFGDQAHWRTVTGGARRYVDAILRPLEATGRVHLGCPVTAVHRHHDHVEVTTPYGTTSADHVVLASHSDEALAVLGDPSPVEAQVLGAMRYQTNRAVLHTDGSLLPRRPRARAAWNYHQMPESRSVATLTYDITRLQSLATTTPVLVTLNHDAAIDPSLVLDRFDYAHPIVDAPAVRARRRWSDIDGVRRTSFCGAYWGDGFHEDGVRSAVAVCRRLGGEPL